jgi:uncharacterized GH25 family protein
MKRLLCLLALCGLGTGAFGHFVFVVPQKDNQAAKVVFSEDTQAVDGVPLDKILPLKLKAFSTAGKTTDVTCTKGEHCLTTAFPADCPMLQGSVVYGVMARKDAKPALLVYHPKALLPGTKPEQATVGAAAALEVIPLTEGGKTRFRVLSAGKPVADAEGTAVLPDGKKEKLKTDAEGKTPALTVNGTIAVWFRHTEAKAGEHESKKYEEIKHYATLVIDIR